LLRLLPVRLTADTENKLNAAHVLVVAQKARLHTLVAERLTLADFDALISQPGIFPHLQCIHLPVHANAVDSCPLLLAKLPALQHLASLSGQGGPFTELEIGALRLLDAPPSLTSVHVDASGAPDILRGLSSLSRMQRLQLSRAVLSSPLAESSLGEVLLSPSIRASLRYLHLASVVRLPSFNPLEMSQALRALVHLETLRIERMPHSDTILLDASMPPWPRALCIIWEQASWEGPHPHRLVQMLQRTMEQSPELKLRVLLTRRRAADFDAALQGCEEDVIREQLQRPWVTLLAFFELTELVRSGRLSLVSRAQLAHLDPFALEEDRVAEEEEEVEEQQEEAAAEVEEEEPEEEEEEDDPIPDDDEPVDD
jgi:hypothetical protein